MALSYGGGPPALTWGMIFLGGGETVRGTGYLGKTATRLAVWMFGALTHSMTAEL